MCEDACTNNVHGYLTCWSIELLEVDLDVKIEAQSIREQLEKQKQQTDRMIQNASLIRTETEVTVSNFARQVRVVESETIANARRFRWPRLRPSEPEHRR